MLEIQRIFMCRRCLLIEILCSVFALIWYLNVINFQEFFIFLSWIYVMWLKAVSKVFIFWMYVNFDINQCSAGMTRSFSQQMNRQMQQRCPLEHLHFGPVAEQASSEPINIQSTDSCGRSCCHFNFCFVFILLC